MTQYIKKSALVAEIERRRKDWHYGSSIEAKYKREECDDILSWLEKQGNQKVTVDFKAEDWYVSKVDNKIHNIYGSGKSALEAAKEEKVDNANKIEAKPKFKVGDWITDGKALLYITKFEVDYGYELKAIDGQIFHFVSPELVDAYYHLWTISDAKQGDVLFVKPTENLGKQLIIFGGINSDSRIEYYCCFLNNKFSINGGLMGYDHKYFLPATKKQHDVLMRAMNDAGYTFDFKKKKLRKIKR